jgi:hypothetical protein
MNILITVILSVVFVALGALGVEKLFTEIRSTVLFAIATTVCLIIISRLESVIILSLLYKQLYRASDYNAWIITIMLIVLDIIIGLMVHYNRKKKVA